MERFGESKFDAKISGEMKYGIYSYNSAKIYARECQKFANYVCEVSPAGRHTSLSDAKQYVRSYIEKENLSDKSPYTVKLERSALAKLYQCNGRDFGPVRGRSREEITRSRERTVVSERTGKEIKNTSTRYGRFSEGNHPDEVSWARSTGMRRSEMKTVRGDQLLERDGRYYIRLGGYQCKGGRERELPVIGDVERVKELCERAGNGRVFESVPGHMDVHGYRSEYATELYRSIARPVEDIPKSDRYYCRGELKGTIYDVKAMEIVSQALGHNRISVIAEHYLR